jgi:hypothetical protein
MSNALKNALAELEKKIGGTIADKVFCATICYYPARGPHQEVLLKTGQNPTAFIHGLAGIEYDSVYGRQHIDGRIWTKGLTTLKRIEYNGSEWWEEYPFFPIPRYLVERPWAIVKYGGEEYIVNESEDMIIPMRVHNVVPCYDHGTISEIYEQAAANNAV